MVRNMDLIKLITKLIYEFLLKLYSLAAFFQVTSTNMAPRKTLRHLTLPNINSDPYYENRCLLADLVQVTS